MAETKESKKIVEEQKITPWEVQGAKNADGTSAAIDYNKLIEQFGTRPIDNELLERFRKVTGKEPHHFLKRGIFFCHRELHVILDRYEKGKPFYLYTGRGPSADSMHTGHLIPFIFCKWLQDVFDCPLVIQLTDDEKFLFKEKLKQEDCLNMGKQNAKDIISVGFDPKKTFIFSDYEYMGGAFYRNINKISKCITTSAARATFGFTDSDCIGRVHFASIEAAPAFSNSFPHIFGTRHDIPCLIPAAIDQDPYFRLTRDVAKKLKYPKPCTIYSKFFPALQGPGSKMSSSVDNSAILLTDTPKQIKKKINRYAFSGGQATAELQAKLGADPEVDVACQYLRFFLEDDAKLKQIEDDYRSGKLMTGEVKAICADVVSELITSIQKRRSEVTDEVVAQFMDFSKPMEWTFTPKQQAPAEEAKQ
jgi:tryptophanyl-tRNA synthetase